MDIMGGDSHQDPDSEYDDEIGHIRRSRRLRLRFMQNEQQRIGFIDQSDEDVDDQHNQQNYEFRRSERLKNDNRSGYLNDNNYDDNTNNGVGHTYSLRRLRNRVDSNSNINIYSYHSQDCRTNIHKYTNSPYDTRSKDASHVSGIITSPRRLRARTKKINYKERRPNLQLDDEIEQVLDISKSRCAPASPQTYKNLLSQNHRWNSLSYGVGSGGAGIFGKDYEEEESAKPVMQYHQCIKQIKFLPDELQGKSRDILQMHLENKDFPELPINSFKHVDFDDIVGHDEHINILREALKISIMYPELSGKGLDISKGLLFYGPPGTGKTMTARALASSCSTPDQPVSFFFCSCADVQSKWFGESEKHLKQLFEQARASQPSILFFDEIDGLTPTRSSSENAHFNTIVNTLLTLMDGLKGRGQVIVIAATNRLDTIDSAFLRPGRFDRILEFSLPNREARSKMIQQQMKSFKVSDKLIFEVARATQGCNGADVKFLCSAAIFRAIRRYYPDIVFSKKKIPVNLDKIKVEMEDFSKELIEMKNSSGIGHIVDVESGIELLLPDTWNAVHTFLDSNYAILDNKLNPYMYKRSNYYEPRILISGPKYSGQVQLGNCVRKWLVDKGFRVETLAYPNIENIENVIQNLQYSKMRAIIIYNVENWASDINEPLKHLEILLSELHTVPVLVVGVESTDGSIEASVSKFFECKTDLVESLFHLRGSIAIKPPTAEGRRSYFRLFFEELTKIIIKLKTDKTTDKKDEPIREESKDSCEHDESNDDCMIPIFTEVELRTLDQKFQEVMLELKQRLRGFHRSLAKKHRIFTQPFDSEKYPGYEKIISQSVDLNIILENVDSNYYSHPEEWIRDINIIFQNALLYHTRVKRIHEIMHKAYEFRDHAGALLNTIPSISKLNYWQLKMWLSVKDKLFSLSGISPDKFDDSFDAINPSNSENHINNYNNSHVNDVSVNYVNHKNTHGSNKCISNASDHPNGQSSLPNSDYMDYYIDGTKYRSINRKDTSEMCLEADTPPLVRRRLYKTPINNFSSEEEEICREHNEVQEQDSKHGEMKREESVRIDKQVWTNEELKKGSIDEIDNNYDNKHLSTNNEEVKNYLYTDNIGISNDVKGLRNSSLELKQDTNGENCVNKHVPIVDSEDKSASGSSGYTLDPEIEKEISSLLERTVSISGKLPLNDTITLSSVLWNVIASEKGDENLPEKYLASINRIISRVENVVGK